MLIKRGMLLVLLALLAGCNFAIEDEKKDQKPTLGTPIQWALTPTATSEADDTATAAATQAMTQTPTSTPTNTLTATSTFTPTSAASITPPLTLTAQIFPSITPTFTDIPAIISSPPLVLSPLPTQASIFTQTAPPTSAPGQTFAPPPSFTPVLQVTQTPLPTSAPTAQVCETCGNLRLRSTPGTAGTVVTYLAANTPVTIIGRTEDKIWVQVTLADGISGWVASQYLVITADLNMVSVTGTAQDTAWPTAVPVVGPGGIEVVSGVTSHARQIFLDGRAKGNSAHTFTRVGDSITASPYFLTPIASGYTLGEYSYLQGAISFFAGPNGRGANPFAAGSIAARNGWSTESVLSPALADQNICRAGETPLECEYRLVKPSVALIMLGTNDAGGLPSSAYSANLNRIVQISINMGVIPVLSTIPPKHYNPATDGRVAEFNQIIIATARAYDIPLWNYWLAMSQLPGEGLDRDGVHPSVPPSGLSAVFDAANLQSGYAVRNLTALQVLYTLWQQVLYDGDNAVPATSQPLQTLVPQPTSSGVTPPAAGCSGALPPRLTAGRQGRVTPGLPNKVRTAPSLNAAQVGTIPGEGVFSVISGPQCADGFVWWQVSYQDVSGWTAEGDSSEYWTEPYP